MPLISNKDRYPNDTNISSNDYVIGTDGNSGLTKTFQLDDLQSILNSAGYTRAQMLTIIGNNGLKEGVEYKITDAGNDDETIVVKASSSSELFRMCYNLNDTSDLYQYNISTDSLLVFSPSALGDMTKAVYDQANIAQQVVGTTATQTLTNKTLEDYSNHIHADVLHVRAKATENISKGQAVVITGYNVGEAAEEVALANNTTGVASGIAYEDITTGNFGLIVTAGILENVDTSAFSEGVILYVNGSGNLTPTEPSTGFAQPIAYVLRSNANTGALQILASYPKQDASDVRYSNGVSGLTATDVQAAIDEVKELVSSGGYTDEQAQDAIGTILTDTTEIDFTYDDATPSITAALKSNSIDESKLDTSVNASLDKADNSVQKTGDETIGGIKTFTSSPIVPAPTTDLQAATKKYVDDSITAGGGYTDEQAQDAVGGMLNASEFTYTDATPDVSINQIAASKITGTKTAAFISDFDTEVSNNTDVAANTSARHSAVTVTDSTEIDFTLTGQNITASLKAGSIDESKLDASVNASLDKADSAIQSGDLATVATTGSYTDLIDKPTIPTRLSELSDVDASVNSPSDGNILVFRNAGNDWVLEAKPEGGSNPALSDITDVTLSGVADNEVLAYDSSSGDWINQTASEAGLATAEQGALADSAQQPPSEGAFVDGDKTKLDGIEAGAEVNTIDSVTTGEPTGSDAVLNVVSLTSAEYSAGTPVATTLYLITDA